MADARKRKVLPGIAKKPQGYTSLQLLANSRNEKKHERFIESERIGDADIMQETPWMPEKEVQATIWMNLRLMLFGFLCALIALLKHSTNNIYRFLLSKYTGALLIFLAILTIISFFIVLFSSWSRDCLRATFCGKREKPLPWYRAFF